MLKRLKHLLDRVAAASLLQNMFGSGRYCCRGLPVRRTISSAHRQFRSWWPGQKVSCHHAIRHPNGTKSSVTRSRPLQRSNSARCPGARVISPPPLSHCASITPWIRAAFTTCRSLRQLKLNAVPSTRIVMPSPSTINGRSGFSATSK